MTVLIVGDGTGWLATVLQLHQAGVDCVVFGQSESRAGWPPAMTCRSSPSTRTAANP
jgi:cation diffusion facilitator CzcD-associated flavoprotein CzcO